MNIAKHILLTFFELGEVEQTLPMLPLRDYQEAFAELGYVHYDYECAGWEADFFLEVENDDNVRYAINGSLFYGNFKVSKVEPGDGHFITIQRTIK